MRQSGPVFTLLRQPDVQPAPLRLTSRVSPRCRGPLLLLRQKKGPKEKATRSASNSRHSRTAQGAAGTCGALTSRRCGQPTA